MKTSIKLFAFSITFTLFFQLNITAQQDSRNYNQQKQNSSFQVNEEEQCASHRIHKKLMDVDPAYKAKILANEAQIQSIIQVEIQ